MTFLPEKQETVFRPYSRCYNSRSELTFCIDWTYGPGHRGSQRHRRSHLPRLPEAGASLVIADVDAPRAERLAAELGDSHALPIDITDETAVRTRAFTAFRDWMCWSTTPASAWSATSKKPN